MGRLIYSAIMSLDGYTVDAQGRFDWSAPDLEVHARVNELIEPVLEREGVSLEVHANRLDTSAGNWRPIWRDDAQCAECGEACKRAGLPNPPVVYVGDGYSDRCVALAADRVFARDGLVDYLKGKGVAYEPFEDFVQLGSALGP